MTIGYDPNFIGNGIKIDMPVAKGTLARSVLRKPGKLRKGIYSDHLNFTIQMNKHTKQLMFSAFNMDQSLLRELGSTKGKRSWRKDSDIGTEFQLGNEFYKDRTNPGGIKELNPYDRGHMVMRWNAMWGKTDTQAHNAGKATFVYANSSLQHENLNRDEWRGLEEDVVRKFSDNANDKLIVFTGPIYGSLDRNVHLSDTKSARVPSGFFKVICYHSKSTKPSEKLGVLAFAVFQDEKVLRDRKGRATIKTDRRYQVTISDLQDWTGLYFGKQLYDANPLFYHNRKARNTKYNVPFAPERIPINRTEDMIPDKRLMRCSMEALAERKIIINAAMINPVGNEARGEWISLYNRGNSKLRLKNWKLVDGHGRDSVLDVSVEAGGSIQIKGHAKGKIKLGNEGGSLMLFDDHGCIIDHVSWSKHDLRRTGEGMAYMFERGQ